MKVYEVVVKGAVEGGYVYAEKSVAMFATLEDAKAFAKSAAVGGVKIPCYLDCANKLAVYERVVGMVYDSSAPVASVEVEAFRSSEHDGAYVETLPRYDANGLDSGLWCVTGYLGDYYDNLSLGIRRDGTLVVGQYPEWDGESYKEDGTPDAEYVALGEFECENPYQNEDASEQLLCWLDRNELAKYDG